MWFVLDINPVRRVPLAHLRGLIFVGGMVWHHHPSRLVLQMRRGGQRGQERNSGEQDNTVRRLLSKQGRQLSNISQKASSSKCRVPQGLPAPQRSQIIPLPFASANPLLFEDFNWSFSNSTFVSEIDRSRQEEENDRKLDDDGRRALLAESRDLSAELARWKARERSIRLGSPAPALAADVCQSY